MSIKMKVKSKNLKKNLTLTTKSKKRTLPKKYGFLTKLDQIIKDLPPELKKLKRPNQQERGRADHQVNQ
jgi:predicted RNA-binding protein with RPS1 domain